MNPMYAHIITEHWTTVHAHCIERESSIGKRSVDCYIMVQLQRCTKIEQDQYKLFTLFSIDAVYIMVGHAHSIVRLKQNFYSEED